MLKIVSAQFNPTVGDIAGNSELIANAASIGLLKAGTDALVVCPEMCLAGYPVEDLVLQHGFVEECMEAAESLAYRLPHVVAVLFGTPWRENGKCYNAAVLAYDGKIQHVFKKTELPNYGVFDEKRIFDAGEPAVFRWKGHCIGVAICEDIWHPRVCQQLKAGGAELIVSPNGSPWDNAKFDSRVPEVHDRVKEVGLPILYVNQWGGQDELVFDGQSFALNPHGGKAYQASGWGDELALITFDKGEFTRAEKIGGDSIAIDWEADGARHDALYRAMVVGLRDYLHKNRFKQVVLGLSGGVDSALVATMAADAIGAENVTAVLLPSQISSDHSKSDAWDLVNRQGLNSTLLEIQPTVDALRAALADEDLSGVAGENLQARARGNILMGIANARPNTMLLSTGNKSEVSVGYATLYGDMAGGFNPLKDIYKTDVFALCRWRNSAAGAAVWGEPDVIPENILTKPPSAELSEDQVDTDSLPEYDTLDYLLKLMLEDRCSPQQILAAGAADPEVAKKVWNLVFRAEHKRRQACPGVRVTPLSHGARDRRFPITNGWQAAFELAAAEVAA